MSSDLSVATSIRVSPELKSFWYEEAKKSGLKPSRYLCHLVKTQRCILTQDLLDDLKQTTQSTKQVHNNLNQIAKVLNTALKNEPSLAPQITEYLTLLTEIGAKIDNIQVLFDTAYKKLK